MLIFYAFNLYPTFCHFILCHCLLCFIICSIKSWHCMPIRTGMIHTCRQWDNDVILELLKLFFFADDCLWCLKAHQKQLYHWIRMFSPFGSNETHILLRVEHIKVILLLVPFLPPSQWGWLGVLSSIIIWWSRDCHDCHA